MATLLGLWKILVAMAGAFAAWQAWQAKQDAAMTDQVDSEADQAAQDATSAKTPEEFAKAAGEFDEAEKQS